MCELVWRMFVTKSRSIHRVDSVVFGTRGYSMDHDSLPEVELAIPHFLRLDVLTCGELGL